MHTKGEPVEVSIDDLKKIRFECKGCGIPVEDIRPIPEHCQSVTCRTRWTTPNGQYIYRNLLEALKKLRAELSAVGKHEGLRVLFTFESVYASSALDESKRLEKAERI